MQCLVAWFGRVVLLTGCGFGAAAACDKRAEPPPPASVATSSAATPSLASNAAPKPSPGRTLVWAEPKDWRPVSGASGMRKATYAIPKASGDAEDGELAVFYFGPNMGGSVDANLDRWAKQFTNVDASQVKRDERSSNGLVQHTLEIGAGTYASGMPGAPTTPKPGYALLGAIVESPSGSYFFKLTGPRNTVQRARSQFFELLDSVKAQ